MWFRPVLALASFHLIWLLLAKLRPSIVNRMMERTWLFSLLKYDRCMRYWHEVVRRVSKQDYGFLYFFGSTGIKITVHTCFLMVELHETYYIPNTLKYKGNCSLILFSLSFFSYNNMPLRRSFEQLFRSLRSRWNKYPAISYTLDQKCLLLI